MKKAIIIPILLLSVYLNETKAQDKQKKEEKETIIIEDNKGNGNTSIEIRNGEVYVDGKKVTDGVGDKNKNVTIKKKVIINGKELSDEETEKFSMPFSGFDMQSDKPMLGVSTKSAETNDGAVVESIVPNSPASKIGLKAGDVITKVGDKLITSPKELVDAIGEYKAGDKLAITFERDAKMLTKDVTLSGRRDNMSMSGVMPFDEEFFKQFEQMMPRMGQWEREENLMSPGKSSAPKIGVSVEDRADGDGVLVTNITEGSSAEKAGIKKGDVIVNYNTKEITNVDELVNAIGSAQTKDKVNVDVKRNGQLKTLSITIPKHLKKKDL